MRRALRLSACALAVFLAPALSYRSAAAPPAPYSEDAVATAVAEASRRFGIPAAWIWRVIRAESGGNASAVSPAGAIGLMQLMPATYEALRQRHGFGADAFAVRDNVLAGTAYLRELHDRYGAVGMLAAYNAGPGRWEAHVTDGRPLPAETRRYLARLAPGIAGRSADVSTPVATAFDRLFIAPLFIPRAAASRPPRDGVGADVRSDAVSSTDIPVDTPAPFDPQPADVRRSSPSAREKQRPSSERALFVVVATRRQEP